MEKKHARFEPLNTLTAASGDPLGAMYLQGCLSREGQKPGELSPLPAFPRWTAAWLTGEGDKEAEKKGLIERLLPEVKH